VTWLMYFLIAVTLALIAVPLLLVAIGRPKLKHHLDEQTRACEAEEELNG
jgi:hypothetical protein